MYILLDYGLFNIFTKFHSNRLRNITKQYGEGTPIGPQTISVARGGGGGAQLPPPPPH